jgi:S-adenosylmethionine hydrolase
LVDISHDVPPHSVFHGARLLAAAAQFFPAGTIHVAVVDPGVGSARRGIALRTPQAIFVGPDNGLFSAFVPQRVACVSLTNPLMHRHSVSSTFHGRDIFAPVAAHLANGLAFTELGPVVDDPIEIPEPQPQRLAEGQLRAEVVYVDRFGNLVTNIRPFARESTEPTNLHVVVGGVSIAVHHSYADALPGGLLALIGSDGFLEIAVREGSAAERLALGVGAPVEVWGI